MVTFLGYPVSLNENGYPYVTIDGRNILCHRIVAEVTYKHSLRKREVVHHINRIRTDYRPQNLMIFATQNDHMNFHKGGNLWFDSEGVAHASPPERRKKDRVKEKSLRKQSRRFW